MKARLGREGWHTNRALFLILGFIAPTLFGAQRLTLTGHLKGMSGFSIRRFNI
jgi:hypothetical protein